MYVFMYVCMLRYAFICVGTYVLDMYSKRCFSNNGKRIASRQNYPTIPPAKTFNHQPFRYGSKYIENAWAAGLEVFRYKLVWTYFEVHR